jgi:hypothetical protein
LRIVADLRHRYIPRAVDDRRIFSYIYGMISALEIVGPTKFFERQEQQRGDKEEIKG